VLFDKVSPTTTICTTLTHIILEGIISDLNSQGFSDEKNFVF
jgi:hypothetical protein